MILIIINLTLASWS